MFEDKTVWVAISNETAKLFTCNSSGKTVFWNSKKEASQKIQDSGFEVEFYLSEENQDKLVAAEDVKNFSKYG